MNHIGIIGCFGGSGCQEWSLNLLKCLCNQAGPLFLISSIILETPGNPFFADCSFSGVYGANNFIIEESDAV